MVGFYASPEEKRALEALAKKQTKNSKWRAWTAGEDAYARGSALTDNPYRGFNEYLAKQWDSGWISAANPPTRIHPLGKLRIGAKPRETPSYAELSVARRCFRR